MSTSLSTPIDRRSFLKFSALAGGGLALAYAFRSAAPAQGEVVKPSAESGGGAFAPNAFLRVASDGSVTIYSARPELGQRINTSLPMIVAEELEVAWRNVNVVAAPLDPAFGEQSAHASSSTPSSYLPMRRVGATARTMLIQAAAEAWGVPVVECEAETGAVHHRGSGRSLTYGKLVAAAARLPVPDEQFVRLKDPRDFKLLGSRIGGVDNPQIVTGQPLYGIDQKVPGMLHAVYEKCPVWGGKVVEANLEQIRSLPGVRGAFVISRGLGGLTGLVPGVAIVADSTWMAFRARQQLRVRWDGGAFAGSSWAGFVEQARDPAQRSQMVESSRSGDAAGALAGAAQVIAAEYSHPFLAHATLEPQNCLVQLQEDRAEIWAPSQSPGQGRDAVAKYLGLPPGNITVHITRSGGGFGRRGGIDYMLEAAAIAQKAGAPVKLVWSREDDLRHDHYRPGGIHFLKGGLDARGRLTAWSGEYAFFQSGLGPDRFPIQLAPNYLLKIGQIKTGVPMGAWRAPGSHAFGFVVGSFFDELAHAAGRDPVEFNLEALAGGSVNLDGKRLARGELSFNAARMSGVIRLAAEKSGWGEKLPRGRGRGLGYYLHHQGYVAEVADVTVSPEGGLRVDRVVAAVDVGSQIINLSGAEGQVQGAIIDGLSAAWRQELDIQKGRVIPGNFDAYRTLRLPEAPRRIDVHFLKTDYPPTGLGEPGLPPIAPAVANAIFAATGVRIRELPFSRTNLRWT